jgi:hypothetical protein
LAITQALDGSFFPMALPSPFIRRKRMSLTFWIVIAGIACLAIGLFLVWFNRQNSVQVHTPQVDDRQLAKLKPYFRREVVEAKVKSLFPHRDPAEILQLLDSDLPSFWGLERMQLDILKLSNGNLDQLRYYIEVARSERDFMKVINLAEYPESSQRDIHDKDFFWDDHKRDIERDFRQYLDWLKTK